MNPEPPAFRLILLPGVGADERLFRPQREAFTDCHTPEWLWPQRIDAPAPESLPDYARRMAEVMHPLCAAERPVVIGGASFGGMVAYEAARYLPVDAVVMIGSCRRPRGVRSLLRLTRPVAPAVPSGALGLAKMLSPTALEMLSNLGASERKLCVQMFKAADGRFMKWALSSILCWQPGPPPGLPVHQIHGARDLLLPVDCVAADAVIPTGGHMINLTHPTDVNAFIAQAARLTHPAKDRPTGAAP